MPTSYAPVIRLLFVALAILSVPAPYVWAVGAFATITDLSRLAAERIED